MKLCVFHRELKGGMQKNALQTIQPLKMFFKEKNENEQTACNSLIHFSQYLATTFQLSVQSFHVH